MREPGSAEFTLIADNLDQYDAIIDVRSPGEFALDHLPGAISLPVLSDDERARVGTVNAQESSFAANHLGARLVTTNIGQLLAGPLADKPKQWRALVYCWRGGNRSGSLATVLARIGYRVDMLDGGYRAYRRWVVQVLPSRCEHLDIRVIAGRTGSGKSRILDHLRQLDCQVLDLEGIANHRGSVLGLLPGTAQPSQKGFESQLQIALGDIDPARPVFVESESKKIGQLQLPESLVVRMRESPCHIIDMSVGARARFLLDDYAHFVADADSLAVQLEKLRPLHGAPLIEAWLKQIHAGQWQAFVESMLSEHYDPAYDKSMVRNFHKLDTAKRVSVLEADSGQVGPDAADFSRAATTIANQVAGKT